MRNHVKKLATFLSLLLLLPACSSLRDQTIHDEILTYQVPFDKGYLQILEVGSTLPGWTLEFTSKAEGLIMLRKKKTIDDVATLVVKNLDKKLISVELAKESQAISGVDGILKAIDESFLRAARQRPAVTEAPSADEVMAEAAPAAAEAEVSAPA